MLDPEKQLVLCLHYSYRFLQASASSLEMPHREILKNITCLRLNLALGKMHQWSFQTKANLLKRNKAYLTRQKERAKTKKGKIKHYIST